MRLAKITVEPSRKKESCYCVLERFLLSTAWERGRRRVAKWVK
jgi:hypothetical protein